MIAVVMAVAGVAVMVLAMTVVAVVVWHHELVHHVVADHDFVGWVDVWRVGGRQFGSHRVGVVRQCFRAMVDSVAVELLQEGARPGHAVRQYWLVAARVPRGTAFTRRRGGGDGEVPSACRELVEQAVRNRRLDAVLCGDGLLVVRAASPRGLTDALAVVVGSVRALQAG